MAVEVQRRAEVQAQAGLEDDGACVVTLAPRSGRKAGESGRVERIIMAWPLPRSCRMRSLALSFLLALVPLGAAAQSSTLSVAMEAGLTRDSVAVMGDRTRLALFATRWLTGELDASARVAWGFAARTDGRAADGSFEAGAGLRYGLTTSSTLRPELLVSASFVQVMGRPGSVAWTSDWGVRLGAGAALEAFLVRDLSLSLVAEASQLMLSTEGGGPGLGIGLRAAAYF